MTNWLRAALVRAARTAAQTAIALIGTAQVVESVPWEVVASGSGLAAILSLLTAVAGLPEVTPKPKRPAGPYATGGVVNIKALDPQETARAVVDALRQMERRNRPEAE